jgi:hypothetical protein
MYLVMCLSKINLQLIGFSEEAVTFISPAVSAVATAVDKFLYNRMKGTRAAVGGAVPEHSFPFVRTTPSFCR